MNPADEDEAALIDLIDRDAPVIRMIAVAHFDSHVTMELPSGRTFTGREVQVWVERVCRQRLAGPRVEPAVNIGWQGYADAVARYVAGTGTLDELTDAVTPEVAARISGNEHEAAKRRESDRAAAVWAAARNKHRHVKRAVALVGANRLASFVFAVVVALFVVPWAVCGLDSAATGWGFLVGYALAFVSALIWAGRNLR